MNDERIRREQERRERERALERAREQEAKPFERKVYLNRLGFGVGSGLSFASALGCFVGAYALALEAKIDYSDKQLTNQLPPNTPFRRGVGYGLAITTGVGFVIAGITFAVLSATSRKRLARRVSFEFGATRLHF